MNTLPLKRKPREPHFGVCCIHCGSEKTTAIVFGQMACVTCSTCGYKFSKFVSYDRTEPEPKPEPWKLS